MFVAGLDVGTYEFKEIEKGSKNNARVSGNLIVNGRYLFEFDRAIERYVKIAIKVANKNGTKIELAIFIPAITITIPIPGLPFDRLQQQEPGINIGKQKSNRINN